MNFLVYPMLLLFLLVSGGLYAQDSTEARVTNADEVSITCSGTCSCSLEGVLSGEESYVTCTCNECTMQVTITESGLQEDPDVFNLSGGASIEVPFVAEFLSFETVSGETFELIEASIYRNGDDIAVLFEYKGENGNTSTVMFARAGGKTYRINCEGPCGCREVYSFETNTASCSCDDCTMIVEEVSNQ